MRFAMTDEQDMLRDAVRGALARDLALPRLRASLDAGDADADVRAIAVAQGWTGIGVEEDAGGQGGGVVEQVVLAEELGRAGAPSSGLIAGALAARILATADGGDLLAALAAGDRAVVPALEAAGGAPGEATVDAGCADAEIAGVLGLPGADVVLLVEGGGVHAVEVGDPGCHVVARALVDPGRAIGDLVLTRASATALGGAGPAREAAALGAVLVAAEAVGAAQRLLDMTVEYVGQREQFGVVIGSFQAIKHTAADMLVEIETARSLVLYAAWSLDARAADAASAVAMAKSYAAPAAAAVADKALALHGAVGFTWEHDLHIFLKRTHTAKALFGSAGTHRERLAETLDLTGTGALAPAGVA